jgi:hypothetical protein
MSTDDPRTDDQVWLDALAGRASPASATTREAQALRAALRATGKPQNVSGLRDARREEALITRAVREGLIASAMPRRRTTWQLPLAASVLLVIAAGVILQSQLPDTPVVRGDEDGVVRLQSTNAAALKRQILEELRAAGATATGYEALDVHGIDADLPLPLSSEIKRVLTTHGIAEPADGVLRIEIRSSE